LHHECRKPGPRSGAFSIGLSNLTGNISHTVDFLVTAPSGQLERWSFRGCSVKSGLAWLSPISGMTDIVRGKGPMHALTIVCPVDYSDCSKRALRYAGALAEYFDATLAVVHVFDPMLTAATAIQQFDLLGPEGDEDLRLFTESHLPVRVRDHRFERVLTVGSPGAEILKLVTAHGADLVVMGTHGFSGMKKLFFGSTLKAVLANARTAVLAVPLGDHREVPIEAPLISSGPIVVPVDCSPQSRSATRAAAGLARALNLRMSLLHVIVPRQAGAWGWQHTTAPGARTGIAEPRAMLNELADSFGAGVEVTTEILHGNPAVEIARYAREKRAAFIVMSLRSSAMHERSPGSVAYRVLCLAPVPILALPAATSGHTYFEHPKQRVRLAEARCPEALVTGGRG
jgi:universal stress protein A